MAQDRENTRRNFPVRDTGHRRRWQWLDPLPVTGTKAKIIDQLFVRIGGRRFFFVHIVLGLALIRVGCEHATQGPGKIAGIGYHVDAFGLVRGILL